MSAASTVRTTPVGRIDAYFGITARGSRVSREIIEGLTMLLVSAYIVVVNPAILSFAGIEGLQGLGPGFAPTMAMTCLTAGICSIFMGVYGRYPILMAPGMGLNAVVAFSLVAGMGLTWQEAMGIILMEGLLIMVLVLTGLREVVMDAVPVILKRSIGVGIGLFIALIGFVNGGFVVLGVPGAPLALGDLATPTAAVLVFGLVLTFLLEMWRVRGGMLIAILLTTGFAILVNAMTGGTAYPPGIAVLPSAIFAVPDFSTFGAGLNFGSFAKVGVVATLLAVFTLCMADFFDTMGTLLAVGANGKFLDAEDNYPKGHLRRSLIADSAGPIVGGFLSASSATVYIESTVSKAKTGLAAVVAGLGFLALMWVSPLASVVPSQATAPALILIGFLMFRTNVPEILSEWQDMKFADQFAVGVPAVLTMLLMPFSYSITAGIGVGFITYTVLQLLRGRMPHWMMMILSVLFVIFFMYHV